MSNAEKTILLRINGADFVWLVIFGYLAIDKNPLWWLAVASVIAGWFIVPKWHRVTLFKWRAKK